MKTHSKFASGLLFISCISVFPGCASTYSDLVSGNSLGAQEYQPAVYVPNDPAIQGKYQQILALCRQVAAKRQVTAAQEAQLKTITGVTEGAANGAAMGYEMGSIFKSGGFDTSLNRSTAAGGVIGAVASLADSFGSGAENDAAETKKILLRCLRTQQTAIGYRVLE